MIPPSVICTKGELTHSHSHTHTHTHTHTHAHQSLEASRAQALPGARNSRFACKDLSEAHKSRCARNGGGGVCARNEADVQEMKSGPEIVQQMCKKGGRQDLKLCFGLGARRAVDDLGDADVAAPLLELYERIWPSVYVVEIGGGERERGERERGGKASKKAFSLCFRRGPITSMRVVEACASTWPPTGFLGSETKVMPPSGFDITCEGNQFLLNL